MSVQMPGLKGACMLTRAGSCHLDSRDAWMAAVPLLVLALSKLICLFNNLVLSVPVAWPRFAAR